MKQEQGGLRSRGRPAHGVAAQSKKAARNANIAADMAKKPASAPRARRASALTDTRIIYCGDNLDQLPRLPDACIDLIYIDLPFNSNRNYEGVLGRDERETVVCRSA